MNFAWKNIDVRPELGKLDVYMYETLYVNEGDTRADRAIPDAKAAAAVVCGEKITLCNNTGKEA